MKWRIYVFSHAIAKNLIRNIATIFNDCDNEITVESSGITFLINEQWVHLNSNILFTYFSFSFVVMQPTTTDKNFTIWFLSFSYRIDYGWC